MKFQIIPTAAGLRVIACVGLLLAPVKPALGQGSATALTAPSITVEEAIRRATINEPNFAARRAEQRVVALDRSIAHAALLPGVVYHNQALYTQPNGAFNSAGPKGSQPAPIFIANNAVREYASQALVTETIGLVQLANVQASNAAAVRAAAELEIARRGLVAATTNLFFTVIASERKLVVLQRASDEASSFVSLTEKREAAREVAHADVIKAELTSQQRTRDFSDAVLTRNRARLELAMLLFPDPVTAFTVVPPGVAFAMPALADVEAAAKQHNPELASALSALRVSDAQVLGARAAYLPDLAVNFAYGIDGTTFATKAPFDIDAGRNPRNLGYSIAATVDIPVWDWLSTDHRIKQSEARRNAVRVALTAAQKRLVVDLEETYAEAQTAQSQFGSLDATAQAAEESLRLTKLRYGSGEATALEVVDAQTTLYVAQTAREDAQVRSEQALTGLQLLMGTL